jgi:hypothetical protein
MTVQEKSVQETSVQPKSHVWVYVALVVVIVALMIAGVALWSEEQESKEARAKAQEFIGKLEAAGLAAPSEDAAVRLFGTDGGSFIREPDMDLWQAEYAWVHGTSGAATRPVILDPEFLEAASIFVSVYAPEKMEAFESWVDGLKLQETID